MFLKVFLLCIYYNYASYLYKPSIRITQSCFINSMVHSYTTLFLSVMYLLNVPLILDCYHDLMCLSCYFATHDIYIVLKYNLKNKISIFVHHSLIIIAIVLLNLYYVEDNPKKTLLALNYLTEISTPFLNKSTMLYNNNNTKGMIYNVSIKILVITFFIARILGGIYYISQAYYQPLFIFICQIILTSLNFVWFYKIINMVYTVSNTDKLNLIIKK
jgi:hypothetical protein